MGSDDRLLECCSNFAPLYQVAVMKLLTEVAQPGPFVTLEPESHVVLSGSCFAEHIGRRLAEALPEGHVCGCPRGVLYNPASLLAEAEGLLTDGDSGRRWFEGSEGMWHDWDYASAYSAPSRAALAAMLAVGAEALLMLALLKRLKKQREDD